MTNDLRKQFNNYLTQFQTHAAIQSARALLHADSGVRQWRFIKNSLRDVSANALGLKPLKVGLLASFSIEFIHDYLISLGFINGLHIEIYQSGFAQYHQEILNPQSDLYGFKPDVVILAIQGQDLEPGLYEDFLKAHEERGEKITNAALCEMTNLIDAFRHCSDAMLLVHNFDPPSFCQLGILDGYDEPGQITNLQILNHALYTIAKNHHGVYVVDYAGLVKTFGAVNWYDRRMELYAKAPIQHTMLPHLANEHLKYIRALVGHTRKCLVVDLDNTLWGGILGEDGVDGIRLGPTYPGSAFLNFQKTVLSLYNRGVILAIASKNNPEDVSELFSNHPHMLLKEHHFSHKEIHWNPKSTSLTSIANTLNIGLEHIVFMDDNPAECSQVQTALPMVTVILFPKRPEEAIPILLKEGLFDGLSYSSEDRKRSQLYQQRSKAEDLRNQSDSLEDFYHSLEMRVVFKSVNVTNLPRFAQLTQKTNQFNLTTRRYSETEISQCMNDPTWVLTAVQVIDRFGDNGIVGLTMAKTVETTLEIDTFLLSCRVIGRTIESALLAHLTLYAKNKHLKTVRGRVITTQKNQPARDLFQKHGFTQISGEVDAKTIHSETLWEWDLDKHPPLPFPHWLSIEE